MPVHPRHSILALRPGPPLVPSPTPLRRPATTFIRRPLRPEDQDAQRRQDELGRARLALPGLVRRRDSAEVAHVAAAVNRRVAVQHLAPFPRARQANPVPQTRHGRQVRDHHQLIEVLGVLAQEGHHAVQVVRAVYPMKAVGVVVRFPEGRLRQVQLVQVLDELLQTAMIRPGLQQPPIQFGVGIPFGGLAEFPAHEQQLLARKEPLIPQQCPQVREPPPIIARHPAQQRALAVHHLVVGQRQDEILVMVIEHREREIVLMVLPMNRVVAEITERVMHPAHVPLERETQSAHIRRTRHLRPGSGLFGDGHHARKLGVGEVIELADELDGFQVLAPAVLVGNPLRPGAANSRGKASRPPRPPAGRPRESGRTRTAHWPAGS